MKYIPLTKGHTAKVDDEDLAPLSQYRWHYNKGYAERKEYRDGKQFHVRMHQVLTGASFVDHRNGDTLDNRRSNLRPADHSTNAMNMKRRAGRRYKGVSKAGKGWRVQIWKDSRKIFSATTPTERWAAMMYDLNAPALFGEYARPNFPGAISFFRE